MYTEIVFLKADRALSKVNFPFSFEIKTNLVTFKKYNSSLQYKIDLSFSIKLQKNKLYVCEEYFYFSKSLLEFHQNIKGHN